ncbi:PIN domain protein [Aquisphaera giovannonii]|uniref:PIN domain protein n=1 Tax=Aquisphaera giovannonii TaxID=406548 RepID=A0A5B9WEG0_9BACT|nr:PIN domain-containing protein [Aquisphaera giovannonii]QEH38351.1 PIN domain protein [Aquisphaera giovannonii]
MVFLGTCPVIYLIEQPAILGPVAKGRVAGLLGRGEVLAVSDLVRMECLVGPLKRDDAVLLAGYRLFFESPDVRVLPISPAVCDRAAEIRARHGIRPLDSLHLAAAVEHGCSLFLSNDAQLKRFPDVVVEILA